MTDPDVIYLPTPERLRRHEIEREEKQIADIDGNISYPFRHIDTLRAMELRGSITKKMRDAGEEFRSDFSQAHFIPLRAADMARVPGCGTARDIKSVSARCAADRVWDALLILGGLTSPSGQIAWGVLGEQKTLEEWIDGGGWTGRRLHAKTAAGILIGTLAVLESHYEKVKKEMA